MTAKSQKPEASRLAGCSSGPWISAVLVALAFLFLAHAPAFAQEAQKGFVPAESIARQEVPSGPLILSAYAFVWVAVLVYVISLWRRIARVERELGEVNRKIAR
jgi:CcmD family protein